MGVEREVRAAARGRDDATPVYLHTWLFVGIAGVVAIVAGICLAIYYLA
jgi:hypothetical protein